MFEAAEGGHRVTKAAYDKQEPGLRSGLLEAQRALATSDRAMVVLIGGAEGAGKEEIVSLLLEWMDARGVETHAMWEDTDEERERPRFWRYWRVLPPKGKIAILFGSWYSEPIINRVFHRTNELEFERAMRQVVDFEQMLANEGVLLAKFWLHLAKGAQKKRLKEMKRDPRLRWRVSPATWKFFKDYDAFRGVSERAVELTSTGFAPWTLVDAEDKHYRNLTVVTTLLHGLRDAVARKPAVTKKDAGEEAKPLPTRTEGNVIRALDLGKKLTDREYDRAVPDLQARLGRLARKLNDSQRSTILVFEGPDAAGKGGAIRRLAAAVDPRLYRMTSVAAPTDEERAHPYLWRFWRDLPRQGHVTIYDRSWYGRVLVERVEGFCSEDDWRRAYSEINGFEQQLADFGIIIIKFWLAISPEEQLKRFKDRQVTPYKQYKITEEDWRNRAKWDAYEAAAADMVERTSTDQAPWVLVEANDKAWARTKVLKTVVRRLKKELK
jgi:polyphosphate:AMP phosphotransferase